MQAVAIIDCCWYALRFQVGCQYFTVTWPDCVLGIYVRVTAHDRRALADAFKFRGVACPNIRPAGNLLLECGKLCQHYGGLQGVKPAIGPYILMFSTNLAPVICYRPDFPG